MTEVGLIYKLIPALMKDIGAIQKNRQNTAQKYSFRGIEDMYNAAHPVLAKHGVFCTPLVVEHQSQDRVTYNANGEPKTSIRVWLKIEHRFFAPDGSYVPVITCGEGIDNSDKASNKAMSAAMKYAFIELLAIPTEDVEDADKDSPDAGQSNGKANEVEVTTKEIPFERVMPPKDDLITEEQAARLHTRFREALRKDLQKDAKDYLHDWLGTELWTDEHGNPTANAITKAMYPVVGQAALKYARSL